MGIARDDKPMRQDWVLRGFRQFDAPVSLVRQNGPTSVSVRLADFAHSDHPRYSAANAMDFPRLADTFESIVAMRQSPSVCMRYDSSASTCRSVRRKLMRGARTMESGPGWALARSKISPICRL
jgi:hypothetical protein